MGVRSLYRLTGSDPQAWNTAAIAGFAYATYVSAMRVAIYDNNPGGGGAWQSFLRWTWVVGCFLHKLFGKLDDYYGAVSWDDAFTWLESQKKPLTMIQYWGHGSPGSVWLAQKRCDEIQFKRLAGSVTKDSVLWFRSCSVFADQRGYAFSQVVSNTINCVVAGHTCTVGIFQPGLHTRKPGQAPTWSQHEHDWGSPWLVGIGLQWDARTIFCLRASIPKGW